MKHIKLVQLDGKLPNLALMRLAHWHRSQGDSVRLTRSVQPTLFDQEGIDLVYGSAIFTYSLPKVRELQVVYPEVIVGGTGSGEDLALTVEKILGVEEYEHHDYSIYPEYPWSIGFTQRGCRLNCGFCVVPKKEGKPRSVNTIQDIWRPETQRNIVLLDNDFFGQDEAQWQARISELREGKFKVNFHQGINIRTITETTATAIAQVRYYDHHFKKRRLHTAWDNLGQERVFFRGVERLEEAGVSPKRLMVYMLIGYAPGETMEQILHRYQMLTERGCRAFPMVYGEDKPELKKFQRWVVRRYSEFIPWEDFRG